MILEPCFVVDLDEHPLMVERARSEWIVRYRGDEFRGRALVPLLEDTFAGRHRDALRLGLEVLIRQAERDAPADDAIGRDRNAA